MGTLSIVADPIVGFQLSIPEVIISGWEEIPEDELHRISRYPCAFCYVTEISSVPDIFEQEEVEQTRYFCGIKIVDEGSAMNTLEKKMYRYTNAIWRMLRTDMFLKDSGWAVQDLARVYSATVPSTPFLKAGMVSFTVKMAEVA